MRSTLILLLALAMTGCTTRSLMQGAFDLARTDGETIRMAANIFTGYDVGDNPLAGTYRVEFELPDGSDYALYFRTLDRPNAPYTSSGAQTMFLMARSIAELPDLSILEDAENAAYMGGIMYQDAMPSKDSAISYALTFHSTMETSGYEPLVHAIWSAVEARDGLQHALPDFTRPETLDGISRLNSAQYAYDRKTLLFRYQAKRVGDDTYGR